MCKYINKLLNFKDLSNSLSLNKALIISLVLSCMVDPSQLLAANHEVLLAESSINDDATANYIATQNKRPVIVTKQSVSSIKANVAAFLKTQTIGYPGEVNVTVGAVDPNLKLSTCEDMQMFLPTGSRAWGKTSVGVHCGQPSQWTIYVQSTVSVMSQYLVAAMPLAQGATIGAEHLMFENGDLTHLPTGIFTEMSQALGRTVNISIPAGTVLRQENLKLAPVVQRGQSVTLTSSGQGFKVAAEGQALANANDGQIVQVKVASGQVVTGVARVGGQIEVKF